jgi:2-iminobutanoate/2-iminopropanoate deaminase
MAKEIIHSDDAPAAVGPYSQAVMIGRSFIYTAGQVGLDPETMKLVDGGVAVQTEQVLKNLQAVLEAAGSGLEHVFKTTVFLADMNDYKAVNEVYARYFTADPPARSAVQVAALPLGALIEIEVVATVG